MFIVDQYFASRSYTYVFNKFQVKYPDIAVPNNLTIMRLITHFLEFESVSDKKRTGRSTILTDAKLAEVKNVTFSYRGETPPPWNGPRQYSESDKEVKILFISCS